MLLNTRKRNAVKFNPGLRANRPSNNRAQVVETSVTVNNNIPIQDYVHPDDQTHTIVCWVKANNVGVVCLVH